MRLAWLAAGVSIGFGSRTDRGVFHGGGFNEFALIRERVPRYCGYIESKHIRKVYININVCSLITHRLYHSKAAK